MNIEVSNHMTTLEEDTVKKLDSIYNKKNEENKPKAPAAKVAAKNIADEYEKESDEMAEKGKVNQSVKNTKDNKPGFNKPKNNNNNNKNRNNNRKGKQNTAPAAPPAPKKKKNYQRKLHSVNR